MRAFFVAAVLFASANAFAAPQSIGDCEKIADPDAYNRCLAMFGPAAKLQKFSDVPATADAPKAVSRGARGRGRYAARGSRSSAVIARSGKGRVRMVIDMGGGGRSVAKQKRRRR